MHAMGIVVCEGIVVVRGYTRVYINSPRLYNTPNERYFATSYLPVGSCV